MTSSLPPPATCSGWVSAAARVWESASTQAWWMDAAVIYTGRGCNIDPWLKRWTLPSTSSLQWSICRYLSNFHTFGKESLHPIPFRAAACCYGNRWRTCTVHVLQSSLEPNNTGAIQIKRWTNICGCVRTRKLM